MEEETPRLKIENGKGCEWGKNMKQTKIGQVRKKIIAMNRRAGGGID